MAKQFKKLIIEIGTVAKMTGVLRYVLGFYKFEYSLHLEHCNHFLFLLF